MKSQLRRLRNLALNKHESKEKPSVEHDDLCSFDVHKCVKGLEEMRARYEGFLTNGQIISGAAYDFSRSLNDMASFMMETFSEIVDDKIGDIFGMLAKVQFEVSKLLDQFASRVSQTIIMPTERVIAEIEQIEDIREKYDANRRICDSFGMERHEEKLKGMKENYSNEHFVLAKETMKQQAETIFDHMHSLVQEQSKNLLTQATRYHMAQMQFFEKGLESINAVEPIMKQLVEETNIDRALACPLSGRTDFDNDEGLYRSDSGNRNRFSPTQEESSSAFSEPKFIPTKPDVYSKSAPIFPSMSNRKDGGLNLIQKNEEQISMYALPTPSEARVLNETVSQCPSYESALKDRSEDCKIYIPDHDTNILEAQKHTLYPSMINKDVFKDFVNRKANEVQKDCAFDVLPTNTSGRYSHSGPLNNSPSVYVNNHVRSYKQGTTAVQGDYIFPLYKSGPINASSTPLDHSSHSSIHTLDTSSLQICELHKLPLPPPGSTAQVQSSGFISHSAPLKVEAQELPPMSGIASPLPPPPPTRIMTRSFSTSSANHSWERNRYES